MALRRYLLWLMYSNAVVFCIFLVVLIVGVAPGSFFTQSGHVFRALVPMAGSGFLAYGISELHFGEDEGDATADANRPDAETDAVSYLATPLAPYVAVLTTVLWAGGCYAFVVYAMFP